MLEQLCLKIKQLLIKIATEYNAAANKNSSVLFLLAAASYLGCAMLDSCAIFI